MADIRQFFRKVNPGDVSVEGRQSNGVSADDKGNVFIYSGLKDAELKELTDNGNNDDVPFYYGNSYVAIAKSLTHDNLKLGNEKWDLDEKEDVDPNQITQTLTKTTTANCDDEFDNASEKLLNWENWSSDVGSTGVGNANKYNKEKGGIVKGVYQGGLNVNGWDPYGANGSGIQDGELGKAQKRFLNDYIKANIAKPNVGSIQEYLPSQISNPKLIIDNYPPGLRMQLAQLYYNTGQWWTRLLVALGPDFLGAKDSSGNPLGIPFKQAANIVSDLSGGVRDKGTGKPTGEIIYNPYRRSEVLFPNPQFTLKFEERIQLLINQYDEIIKYYNSNKEAVINALYEESIRYYKALIQGNLTDLKYLFWSKYAEIAKEQALLYAVESNCPPKPLQHKEPVVQPPTPTPTLTPPPTPTPTSTPTVDDDLDKKLKKHKWYPIPDAMNCFRSDQLPVDLMKQALIKYNIKTVIRWNGSKAPDNGGVTHDQEKQICDELGIKWIYTSAEKAPTEETFFKYIKQGSVWCHCLHGADRTGGWVGGYLKSLNSPKWTTEKIWAYTVQYNGWGKDVNNAVKDGKTSFPYQKYAAYFGVKDFNEAKGLAKTYPGGKVDPSIKIETLPYTPPPPTATAVPTTTETVTETEVVKPAYTLPPASLEYLPDDEEFAQGSITSDLFDFNQDDTQPDIDDYSSDPELKGKTPDEVAKILEEREKNKKIVGDAPSETSITAKTNAKLKICDPTQWYDVAGTVDEIIKNNDKYGNLGDVYYYPTAIYNQGSKGYRDPRLNWGSSTVGGKGTMGANGCCLVAMSMLLTWATQNPKYTPYYFVVDRKVSRNPADYWAMASITGKTLVGAGGKGCGEKKATMAQLDKALMKSPVVFEWQNDICNRTVGTKWHKLYAALNQHWLIVVGKYKDGTYCIFDPNQGKIRKHASSASIAAGLSRIFWVQ